MENGLKELQQRLVEMLSSFQKFTQQNGMIFFLVGGSALGAVRHQGFIPWDDDVDIAMMREDFEKMEYLMSLQHDRLGEFIYSPVEKHMIPDAPIGYLYDTLHADAGYENTAKIDYEAGNLKVDFTKRQVLLGGTEVHFSPVEYRIIESLALNSGTVVTYQMLLEKIWGPYAEQNSRILRVNMTNIRKKIESSPLEPEYITTIPRVGYRMLESQAEKGGMQMLENQTGRNMKVMEGQNIRNGIRMMA